MRTASFQDRSHPTDGNSPRGGGWPSAPWGSGVPTVSRRHGRGSARPRIPGPPLDLRPRARSPLDAGQVVRRGLIRRFAVPWPVRPAVSPQFGLRILHRVERADAPVKVDPALAERRADHLRVHPRPRAPKPERRVVWERGGVPLLCCAVALALADITPPICRRLQQHPNSQLPPRLRQPPSRVHLVPGAEYAPGSSSDHPSHLGAVPPAHLVRRAPDYG